MSTPIEDLKAWMTANDVEIAELKKDIKGLEKKDIMTTREEDNLRAWRSRLHDLSVENTGITQKLGDIAIAQSQPSEPSCSYPFFFSILTASFFSSRGITSTP